MTLAGRILRRLEPRPMPKLYPWPPYPRPPVTKDVEVIRRRSAKPKTSDREEPKR